MCVGVLWLRFNAPPPDYGSFLPHDLLYSYYPKLDLVSQRLAAGELPLWNPEGCAGVPLLAGIQYAVLYPPTWIAAFVPADRAIGLLVLFHLLLAGLGAALLFVRWRAPPILAGALGGVFVFTCGLGQTFWPPQVATIAWLPWVLLCVEGVMGGGTSAWRWWSALAAVTGLQLLSGFPQHVVYTLHLAVPLALLRTFQRARGGPAERRTALGALAGVALAMLLGVGIAGAQLIPTAELVSESERQESLSPRESQYLQSESRLGTLLANAVDPAPRVTAFEIGKGAGYLGTFTLVLAAVAVAQARRRALTWLLLVLAATSFWLSDGWLAPTPWLFEAYASLPLIGSFRSPERLLLVAEFSLVALAALGAAALGTAALGDTARRERVIGSLAATFAAISIAVAGSPRAAGLAAAALALVLAAQWLPAGNRTRGAWQATAALLLLADVALATGAFGSLRHFPRGWTEVFHVSGHVVMSRAEIDAQRQRVGHGRVALQAPHRLIRPIAGTGPIRGLQRLACYETPVPNPWDALTRLLAGGDFVVMANVDPDRFPALLDAAGVLEVTRVLADPGRRAVRDRGPGRLYARGRNPVPGPPPGTVVSRVTNPDALPRAYLVGEYEVEADKAAFARTAFGDFDLRTQVLVDRTPAFSGAERIAGLHPATIVRYEPERVEIATDAPAEGLLVLSDTHYPGWRATVDGKPVPILRTNGLFRAVVVPGGDHRVVFEFAPSSLRTGAWISGLCILLWIGVCASPWIGLGKRLRER